MLKLGYPYQSKVNELWQNFVFTEKYMFYNFGHYWKYTIPMEDSSWRCIQMVSVDANDDVLGYLAASYDRSTNMVSSIGAINFGATNLIFAKDFYEFLTSLFDKFQFRKIEWEVIVGNPAEKMYDKIIKKYGGRVVGIRHATVKTCDGVIRDVKEYEIFKSDYDVHKALHAT